MLDIQRASQLRRLLPHLRTIKTTLRKAGLLVLLTHHESCYESSEEDLKRIRAFVLLYIIY